MPTHKYFKGFVLWLLMWIKVRLAGYLLLFLEIRVQRGAALLAGPQGRRARNGM